MIEGVATPLAGWVWHNRSCTAGCRISVDSQSTRPLLGGRHLGTRLISPMLSPHPADPTLTTHNLLEVVKDVEHRWEDLGDKLGLPLYRLSGVQVMADVVDEYVRCHPTPSWKVVATVLQEMELDKLADEVTTKYVIGMDVNHVTYRNYSNRTVDPI